MIKKVRETRVAVGFVLEYAEFNRTADALKEAPIEELIGLAESAEYYMNLADQRGKIIDSLRGEKETDDGPPVPQQITTRCTYLMKQEDLDD